MTYFDKYIYHSFSTSNTEISSSESTDDFCLPASIIVDMSKYYITQKSGLWEVPIALYRGILNYQHYPKDNSIIVCPIPTSTPHELFKTSSSFLIAVNRQRSQSNWIIGKIGDHVYKATAGLILNDKDEILYMGTLIVENMPVNEGEDPKFAIRKLVNKVSPLVLANKNNPVEKAIIKNLLQQSFSGAPFSLKYNSGALFPVYGYNFTTIIEDCSQYIMRPIPPKMSDFTDESKQIIVDNLERFMTL